MIERNVISNIRVSDLSVMRASKLIQVRYYSMQSYLSLCVMTLEAFCESAILSITTTLCGKSQLGMAYRDETLDELFIDLPT